MDNHNSVFKGSSKIMNTKNLKQELNIDQIEQLLNNNNVIQSSDEKDISERFENELLNIAKSLDISDFHGSKKSPSKQVAFSSPRRSTHSPRSSPRHSSPKPYSHSSPRVAQSPLSKYKNSSDSESESESDSENRRHSWRPDDYKSPIINNSTPRNPPSGFGSSFGGGFGGFSGSGRIGDHFSSSSGGINFSSSRNENDSSEFEKRTMDEERHEIISNVMKNDIDVDNTFSIEREKQEDFKNIMLDEIDEYLAALKNNDIDISRIPIVTKNSSYKEVQDVHRALKYKNDNIRYCTMAEEFLLLGALGVEYIFDGDRKILGKKIDMSGWSKQLPSKMRRMRTDTTQVVSHVMQDFHIGNMLRIILELVPNAIMYAKNKSSKDAPSVYDEENIDGHIRDLNSIDS